MQIVVNQKSGLGNQLFQYAAGRFFARKLNASLTVVREPAAMANSYGFPRPFLLSRFSIAAEVRERSALDRLLCSEKPRTRALTGLLRNVLRTGVVRERKEWERTFRPDLAFESGLSRLYLEGYWQAWQYADAIEADLRNELAFRQPAEGETLKVLEQIRAASAPVSLHLRRGDFVVASKQENFKELEVVYYERALEAVRARIPDPTFFVFSDEIEYARTHLPKMERAVFVGHNNDATAHDDLRLMAACRHHILANSSFSWWGAWLNPRPDKLVLRPGQNSFFSTATVDLYPPAWRGIVAGD
jgi:hypothetical protein